MRYILMRIFLIAVGLTESRCQNNEKTTVDYLIEYARQQEKNAYYRNLYTVLDKDTIISRTPFPKEVLEYVSRFTTDTLENVRAMSYAIVDRLDSYQHPKRNVEMKTEVVLKLLNGCLDENKEIRRRNLAFISEERHWDLSMSRNNDVIENLRSLIRSFAYELDYTFISLIGKYEFIALNEVLKDHFMPQGASYKNKYGSKNNFYRSLEWSARLALARMKDDESVKLIIDHLNNEKDLDQKYSQARYISLYVGGMKIAEFIYQLYISEEGLKTTEPLGRYSGTPPPRPTLLERYLKPPAIFKHPWPQHLVYEANKCQDISNASEKELCTILVTRRWLTETRGKWVVYRE